MTFDCLSESVLSIQSWRENKIRTYWTLDKRTFVDGFNTELEKEAEPLWPTYNVEESVTRGELLTTRLLKTNRCVNLKSFLNCKRLGFPKPNLWKKAKPCVDDFLII